MPEVPVSLCAILTNLFYSLSDLHRQIFLSQRLAEINSGMWFPLCILELQSRHSCKCLWICSCQNNCVYILASED